LEIIDDDKNMIEKVEEKDMPFDDILYIINALQ
jgi:hypothetical protein